VVLQSFSRYNSFKSAVAAGDVVQAASALIENGVSNPDFQDSGVRVRRSNSFNPDSAEDALTDGQGNGNGNGNGNGDELSSKLVSAAASDASECLFLKSDALLKRGISAAILLQKVRSICPGCGMCVEVLVQCAAVPVVGAMTVKCCLLVYLVFAFRRSCGRWRC
jgi:hypothetical protein